MLRSRRHPLYTVETEQVGNKRGNLGQRPSQEIHRWGVPLRQPRDAHDPFQNCGFFLGQRKLRCFGASFPKLQQLVKKPVKALTKTVFSPSLLQCHLCETHLSTCPLNADPEAPPQNCCIRAAGRSDPGLGVLTGTQWCSPTLKFEKPGHIFQRKVLCVPS